ncbi:MAG: ribonuclease HII [Alphaproteobacteria bacterium]|nr:ribonuclease HII [Alphaproteobacteria bacterium]
MPDFSFETLAYAKGATRVAGVDEVGRGPLAGPVMTAAVILDPDNIPEGLQDSKKLTAKRREGLFDLIMQSATVAIAECSVAEIDQINILQASLLAMKRALAKLDPAPDFALIDGNRLPQNLGIPAQAIIKGDDKSASIAAASIIAKVTRDRLMARLAQEFPGYGWERNAGYGTKQHLEALLSLGVTPHHRVSFKPIHNILYQDI